MFFTGIVNNTMHNNIEQINNITIDYVVQRLKHLYHRDFTDRFVCFMMNYP